MSKMWQPATVGLAVTLGMAGLEAKASANPIDPQTSIEVVIMKHARVSADVFERALREAGRIYKTAGVNLVWIDSDAAKHHPTRHLRLTFVIAAIAPARHPDALGFAAQTENTQGRVAYAFFERVKNFADQSHIEVSLALGLVMAHEIGHLLLSFHSHADAGIMLARWERAEMQAAARGQLVFNLDQAERIRRRVSESAGN